MLSLLMLAGCKKHHESNCVEIDHGTVSFTPQERLIQPYRVHDSLVFINERLNIRVTYSCTFHTSAYQVASENAPDAQGNIECLGNYYRVEYSLTKFYEMPKKFIFLSAVTSYPFDTMYKENRFQVGIGFPGDSIYPFDGFYGFREDSLFYYPHFPYAKIDQFYDTITIGRKLYHKVYLLEGTHLPANYEQIIKIFYSVSEGILGFSTNKFNAWTLQQKFILP